MPHAVDPCHRPRLNPVSSLIAAFALLAAALIPIQTAHAAIYAGYSEYYIPGTERQMWDVFADLDAKIAANLGQAPQLDISQGMYTVISITVTGDNTSIYYDHWEDGYDFDPNDPDNTYDQKWVRSAGEVVTLTGNNIPVNPRGTSIYYDGGDRIYIAGTSATVSRTSWPESAGPVFAISWELFPVKPFLTDYTIPVGRDIATASPFYSDFQRVYVLAQSVTDNNVVQIDDPTTSGVDVTTTLNRGQTTQLFNVNAGTHVKGQQPVQVHFIVGADTRDRYEARGFNAMPEALWDNEYYSPVPGANNGDTDIYLYNPHSTSIIVHYEDNAGSGSFTIPADSTVSYQDGAGRYVPNDSGVYLSSDAIFWGISSVDTESRTYDWGFSLVPVNFLTDVYFLSWAPGTSQATPTSNGSPAFVTPIYDDTVIFVDYSPTDGVADLTVTRNRLETLTVFDPDNVNTGTHIYANGPIALAWGQDPDTAGTGNPYLDLGTANLPMPPEWIDLTLGLEKAADPTVLAPVAGEQTSFTVNVITYEFPVADIAVTDLLPSGFAYVTNSAEITLPDNTLIVGNNANPAISGQTLTWDNATLNNLDMAAGKVLTITYDVVIDGSVGQGQYTNLAQASGSRLLGSQVFSPFDSAVINVTPITIDKDSVTKTVSGGGTAQYTIQVANISGTDATGIDVTDILPSGFTFASTDSVVTTGTVIPAGPSLPATTPTFGNTNLTWGPWNIGAGASVTITFTVNIASTVVPDTYDNTATADGIWGGNAISVDDKGEVAQDLGTPSGEDPENDEDVVIVSLLLDMDTTTPTVSAGGQATYTIVVENDGATIVSGVDISASLPPGFTYASTTSDLITDNGTTGDTTRISASNPTVGDNTPDWGTWNIGPGDVLTITFVADVAGTVAPGTYDASAFADSTQTGLIDDAGPVAGDAHTLPSDTGTDEDVTVQSAVLTIDKDARLAFAVAGSTRAWYTITVTNSGSADATNVVVSDALPTGFTFAQTDSITETLATRITTSDPTVGDASPSWGTWTIQGGGSVAIDFRVDVAGSVAQGNYNNTAGVTSTETGYIDDDGTVAQDDGTPPIVDPVDDEDVYVFANPTLDDAVTITHTEDDNTYDVTYYVDITNNGPSDDPGPITVVVSLPAGIDYLGTYAGGGWSLTGQVGQDLTFTYTPPTVLAYGASATTLVIDTEISATITPVNAIATATVSSTIFDRDASNDTASDPLAVKVADVSTSTKTVFDINGGDVEPGDVLEYTITVKETGDKRAKFVRVTDHIPANVNGFTVTAWPTTPYVDDSLPAGPGNGDNDTGFLDINSFDVPKSSEMSIKFRVTVNNGLADGTAINNTAAIDVERGIDGTATAPTVIVRSSQVPAQGTKPLYLYADTTLNRTPPGAPQSAVEVPNAGTTTWTLSPALQGNLVIDGDPGTIPVVLTLRNGYDNTDNNTYTHNVTVTLASTGTTTTTIGSLTQSLGLNNFSDTTTTFNIPIAADTTLLTGSQIILRVYQAGSQYGDPMDVYPISGAGVFSRTELEAETVVNVDSVAFYDQAYPNGSVIATATPGANVHVRAVVSDPFGSYDISGATVDIVDSQGTIRVNDAVMTEVADPGAATKTYEYAYTIPPDAPVDNWTASVTAAEGTEGAVTDVGVAVIDVNPITGADLSITKSHTDEFYKNQNASFKIQVANLGPDLQVDPVVVTDVIPDGLTYVSSAGSDWSCVFDGGASANGTVTCTYPASAGSPIAAGTVLPSITLWVAIDNDAPSVLYNTVSVSLGSGPENNPTNNTSTDTVYVLVGAVVKTVNATSPYYDGDNTNNELTYTITVTNTGAGTIDNVVVTDALPAGTAYVAGSSQVTAPVDVIRATEYYIAPGSFNGTTYDLTLDNDLAPNYFVIVQGSDGGGGSNGDRGPDEDYITLTHDPFPTGDLSASGANNVLRFTRDNSRNGWVGVVTVVESLNDADGSGFSLVDVVNVTHSGTATSGAISNGFIGWGGDIGRTMLVGGYNGAGCFTTDTDDAAHNTCHARIWPEDSPGNTIRWSRNGPNLSDAMSTVMVVKWGMDWTVQRVRVTGNNGGDGANATDAYNTTGISSVARAHTWVWGTGHTNNNGIGDSGEAVLLTLGDGFNQNADESSVAAGIEYANTLVDFEVYALTHPNLAVDHYFKADGNATDLTVDVATQAAENNRIAVSYNGQDTTNDDYPRPMFSARYWDNDTIRLERRRSGTAFPAWVQGINFAGLSGVQTNPGGEPPNLVTAGDGYSLAPGDTMTVTFKVEITDATLPQNINNTVLVSSDQSASPVTDSVDTVVRTFGDPTFTDSTGNPVNGSVNPGFTYEGTTAPTGAAYLRVVDLDRNIDANAIDTVTVTVTNPDTNDSVTLTLYETGVNTGVFANNSSGERLELPLVACADPQANCCSLVADDPQCTDTEKAQIPTAANSLYVAAGTTPELQLTYTDPSDPGRDTDGTTAFIATQVVLSEFTAYSDAGRVVAQWETASEIGTMGFLLERRDPSTGAWDPVNTIPVRSFFSSQLGGIYRLVDPDAIPGGTTTYRLIEIETSGRRNVYGPFTQTVVEMPADIDLPALTGISDRFAHPPTTVTSPAAATLMSARTAFADVPAVTGDRVKISVSQPGLYHVSAAALAPLLGMETSAVETAIADHGLAMSRGDRPVAWMPASDNTGLYFYGDAVESPYTRTNVYWLAPGEGQIMAAGDYPGDVDGLSGVTLADAVVSLRTVSGEGGSGVRGDYAVSGADVNGNGQVDLAEPLYILQHLAGLRTEAPAAPTPVENAQYFMDTVRAETDLVDGTSYVKDPADGVWFWWGLLPAYDEQTFLPVPDATEPAMAIDTPGRITGAGSAVLRVKYYAPVAVPHLVDVLINGEAAGAFSWSGTGPAELDLSIDAGLLADGTNSVQLIAQPPAVSPYGDGLFIDWIEVVYPRGYAADSDQLALFGDANTVVTVDGFSESAVVVADLSDPDTPRLVSAVTVDGTAGNYRASFRPADGATPYAALLLSTGAAPDALEAVIGSDLTAAANAYDYVVIAPDALAGAADALATYRSGQGLASRVVAFEEIVNAFNGGLKGPDAVRSFLAYAVDQWTQAPRYVVLVGNGTYDWNNVTGAGDNLLPTMVMGTPNGIFASDQLMADVTGDGVPDMAVGRLPVMSAEELTGMIARIQAFEAGSGNWRERATLSAGSPENVGEVNDFAADSDTVAALLPTTFTIDKIYTANGATNADMLAAVNGGSLLLNYIGHGGYDRISGAGLLTLTDVPGLTNADQRPFFAALTCIVGNYAISGADTLGEAMVKNPGGGAIAVWSPTGLSINENAVWLNREFLLQWRDAAAADRRAGELIRRALGNYHRRLGDSLMPGLYNLLGDPAMELPSIEDLSGQPF